MRLSTRQPLTQCWYILVDSVRVEFNCQCKQNDIRGAQGVGQEWSVCSGVLRAA